MVLVSRASTSAATGRSARWRSWWGYAAVPVVVSVLISSIGLGRRQLWRDELATWVNSGLSYSDLWAQSRRVDAVHSPFYAVMHAWVGAFGDSMLSLRMPSVLAAAAAAGVTAEIGRRLYGAPAGLLAGLMLAVTPAMSRYAQEARQYALVVALVGLATLLLLGAVERPTWRRWLPYAAVLATAGLLHVISVMIVPAHALYVGAAWRAGHDRRLGRSLLSVGAALLVVAPVIWYGSRQASTAAWIPPTTLDSSISAAYALSGAEGLGLFLAVAGLVGCWPLDRRALLLVAWAVGPFLALLTVSPVADLLVPRYLLFALPAWCLLAAWGVAWPARSLYRLFARGRFAPAGAWLAVMGAGLVALAMLAVAVPEHRSVRDIAVSGDSDLRGVARVLATRIRPGDEVAYHGRHPRWMRTAMDYYLPAGTVPPVAFLATTGLPPSGSACEELACLDGVQRLWLINARSDEDPFRRMDPVLRQGLRDRFAITDVVHFRNGTLSLLSAT